MSGATLNFDRILARRGSLGEGMEVARALPTRQRRMVGAWCFLDHLGPVSFPDGQGMHVGAHPHTRLQTFTWMIEGEILHRDSLGSEQVIRAGQVNLMTAGYGISHTEDSLHSGQRLHAAQLWIALPDAVADQPPSFLHYPQVPHWVEQGCAWSVMAGRYAGRQSPVQLFSPLLGVEVLAGDAASEVHLSLQPEFEYGLLALEGSFTLQDQSLPQDELVYIAPGSERLHLQLQPHTRLLVLGGEPFAEKVTMWWNFLGADWAAIRGYRAQWEQGDARFGVVAQSTVKLPAPPVP